MMLLSTFWTAIEALEQVYETHKKYQDGLEDMVTTNADQHAERCRLHQAALERSMQLLEAIHELKTAEHQINLGLTLEIED